MHVIKHSYMQSSNRLSDCFIWYLVLNKCVWVLRTHFINLFFILSVWSFLLRYSNELDDPYLFPFLWVTERWIRLDCLPCSVKIGDLSSFSYLMRTNTQSDFPRIFRLWYNLSNKIFNFIKGSNLRIKRRFKIWTQIVWLFRFS